jgi:hypothetical protein
VKASGHGVSLFRRIPASCSCSKNAQRPTTSRTISHGATEVTEVEDAQGVLTQGSDDPADSLW